MTLLALLLLALASWTLGRLVRRLLPAGPDLWTLPLELAAGLGLVALLLGVLALLGALHLGPLALALFATPSVKPLLQVRFALRRSWPGLTLAAALALATATALAPLTDPDSLAYTLPIAGKLATEGRWAFWPDQWRGVFPLSHELLVSVVLRMSGSRPALLSVAEIALAGALLVGLARRLSPQAATAPLALILAFGNAAVLNLCASTKEDALLVVMTLGAAHALLLGGAGGATVAGLFAGLAASAKYPGLPVVAGTLLATAFAPGQRLARAGRVALAAAVAGSLFYAVNLWRFGNPIPPYLSPPLPTFLSPLSLERALDGFHWGVERTPVNALLAPLLVFVTPAPFGGAWNWFHPLLVATLPFLFGRERRSRFGPLFVLAATCYFAWFLSNQVARLLLPAATLLAIPAAEVLGDVWRRSRASRAALALALAASSALAVAIPAVRVTRYALDPSGFLARESQLADDFAWMNAHLRPTDRVGAFFKTLWYLDVPHLHLSPDYQVEISAEEIEGDPERFLSALRRQRVTHLFLPLGSRPALESRLRRIHRNPASRLGGTRFLREPFTIPTAVYEIPDASAQRL